MDDLVELWARRRWPLFQAIERTHANFEAMGTLARLLGCVVESSATQRWQRDFKTARHHFSVIDDTIASAHADAMAHVLSLWLMLEVQFCPNARSRLLELKLTLIRIAEQQEIDLRGMGV